MKPILLINFKTYEEATGKKALELARIIENFVNKRAKIIVAPQVSDIYVISKNTKLTVFSQHVDAISYGSHTGWILPNAIKEAGAKGTLLNHSERKVDLETIKKTLEICKSLHLRTVVCAETPEKAKEIAKLKPDYIAIEPPELIGGDVSVSKAKPEIITKAIEMVNEIAPIPVLCGAGIKNGEDVRKAIELGAKGILVASGVIKAKNPKEVIKDLLEGF
ncbi:MAG: triose-phosphate isomerase [Candidatus Aenigmatarchaeota archaeon]